MYMYIEHIQNVYTIRFVYALYTVQCVYSMCVYIQTQYSTMPNSSKTVILLRLY